MRIYRLKEGVQSQYIPSGCWLFGDIVVGNHQTVEVYFKTKIGTTGYNAEEKPEEDYTMMYLCRINFSAPVYWTPYKTDRILLTEPILNQGEYNAWREGKLKIDSEFIKLREKAQNEHLNLVRPASGDLRSKSFFADSKDLLKVLQAIKDIYEINLATLKTKKMPSVVPESLINKGLNEKGPEPIIDSKGKIRFFEGPIANALKVPNPVLGGPGSRLDPGTITQEGTAASEGEKAYDWINPQHYKQFSKEVIDMMVAIWGPEKVADHCEITAFKYKLRVGSKPGQAVEKDLEKAEWYLRKAEELRTKGSN